MALIKCKDCSKEFSTDAKHCPQCGAKRPPKKSEIAVAWIALLFFGFLAYSCSHDDATTKTDSSVKSSQITKKRALTLKGGHPACLTQDLLSQVSKAIAAQDDNALSYLFENGCVITKEGVPVTELEIGDWGFAVHVRGYAKKHSAETWVYRDAVNGLDPDDPNGSAGQ